MDPMWHTCAECMGTRLVYDRDGDFVCSECGLVKNSRVIDDAPEWRVYDDNDQDAVRAEVMIEENRQHRDRELVKIMLDLDDGLREACWVFFEKIDRGLKHGDKKKAVMASCVYLASKQMSRGYTIEGVIALFRVKNTMFWDCYKKVSQLLNIKGDEHQEHDRNDGLLRRMVHKLDLEGRETWDVLKAASMLLGKCSGSNAKTSKFYACIIYIACGICNVKRGVTRKDICVLYNASLATLKKHEKMVQNTLAEIGGRKKN